MAPDIAAAAAADAEERDVEHDEQDEDFEGDVQGGDDSVAKKKKKKKKMGTRTMQKKKSKGGGGGGGETASQDAACKLTAEERQEADKRFSRCLAEVKSNEEDSMWVSLPHCGLTDAKAKKLFTAMEQNTAVTEMDLSHNALTDAGIQALATALLVGSAAPELITLDLRGNRITDAGLTALHGLQKIRKRLRVLTKEEEAGAVTDSSNSDEDGTTSPPKGITGGGSLANDLFQVGNPEEEGGEPGEGVGGEASSADPQVGWGYVEAALLDGGQGAVAEMGGALADVVEAIGEEMSGCTLPMLAGTGRGELRPHTAAALESLPALTRVLAHQPANRVNQHSPNTPRPVAGIHRVAVAKVVAQLMRGGAAVIDTAIEAEGLLPKLLELALEHPNCSALQATALRILRASLVSPAPGLWLPLVEKSRGDCEDPVPLQSSLAKLGTAAVDVPVGRRSGIAGFVLAAARLLRDVSRGSPSQAGLPEFECRVADRGGAGLPGESNVPGADAPAEALVMEPAAQEELRRWLEEDADWTAFAAPGGALEVLLAQQEQELGGPRPERAPLQSQSSDLANLMASGLSSTDMLRLLKGMSFGMGGQS